MMVAEKFIRVKDFRSSIVALSQSASPGNIPFDFVPRQD